MDTFKKTIEAKDLPKPHTEEERRTQRTLKIAMLIAWRMESRNWHRYPNASQEKFQTKMLRLAKDVLDIANEDRE